MSAFNNVFERDFYFYCLLSRARHNEWGSLESLFPRIKWEWESKPRKIKEAIIRIFDILQNSHEGWLIESEVVVREAMGEYWDEEEKQRHYQKVFIPYTISLYKLAKKIEEERGILKAARNLVDGLQ